MDNDSIKKLLETIAKPYLEALNDRLAEREILQRKNNKENQIPIEEKQTKSGFDKRRILDELYDLRTITQIIYSGLLPPEQRSLNLIDQLDYFVSKNVIDMPLADRRVKSLLTNLNNIVESDITESWYSGFSENKIDPRLISNRILDYYSWDVLSKLCNENGFDLNRGGPAVDNGFDFISKSKTSSKSILISIKFRNRIEDLSNIVLREVNAFANSFSMTNSSLITIVYTNEQDHGFSRLVAQFDKLLIDSNESMLGRIFFLPVGIYKIEELKNRVSHLLNDLKGKEVTFDYDDSPLDHGWSGDINHLAQQSGIFKHFVDPTFGNVFKLGFLNSSGLNYIDYRLIANRKYSFRTVVFVVRPFIDSSFYVEISVRDDKKEFWIKIREGKKLEAIKKISATEYLISAPVTNRADWKIFEVDVVNAFDITFKQDNLTFDKVEGVRLRGEIDIARITFE